MKTKYILPLFIVLSALTFSGKTIAQTVLVQEDFTTYMGTQATEPAGWYFNYQGDYTTVASSGTSGPNSYKFGVNNDSIMSPSFSNADSLFFWIKGEGIDSLSSLSVYYNNGAYWIPLGVVAPLPTKGTTMYGVLTGTGAVQLMFVYGKSVGNLAFDDFLVTQNLPTAVKSVSGISNNITVYPIPAKGELAVHLTSANADRALITLCDITGKTMSEETRDILPGENNFSFNIENLCNGMYFIKADGSTIHTCNKVTVQK